MFRPALCILRRAALSLVLPCLVLAQRINDSIVSEHVRLRIPVEREWLGRDAIPELERVWRFVNGAVDGELPRRVLVDISWDNAERRVDPKNAQVTIGMNDRAASVEMKSFLLRMATREMARLGLIELSKGGAAREEHWFLLEGMAEILAREYERSTRGLGGAWVIAHYLDRMKQLGLAAQSSWAAFSGGKHDLRASAPGVTFLMTCRELYGRERLTKLFEALKNKNLDEGLLATFRSTRMHVENAWLAKVRAYTPPGDVTLGSPEDAPSLDRIECIPPKGHPGGAIEVRLFIKDRVNDISPGGVFLEDEKSSRVLQAEAATERGAGYALVEVPVEPERPVGRYSFRVTAVDEAGNIRIWQGYYTVER